MKNARTISHWKVAALVLAMSAGCGEDDTTTRPDSDAAQDGTTDTGTDTVDTGTDAVEDSTPEVGDDAAETIDDVAEDQVDAQEPIVLRFRYYGTERPFTRVIQLYAAAVDELTGGAVSIDAVGEGVQAEVLSEVVAGDFEGGIWAFSDPATRLLDATAQPGLTDDGVLIAEAGLHLSQMSIVDNQLTSANVVYLAPVIVPRVGYLGDTRLDTVAAFQGLRLRTFGALTQLVNDLGGEGQVIAQPEVWGRMEADELDGGLTSWPGTQNVMIFQPWDDAGRPFPLFGNGQLGIGANAFQLILNRDVWNDLPEPIKLAMREAAQRMPEAHHQETTREDPALEEAFLDAGVTVDAFSPEDVRAIGDAAAAVHAAWVCASADPSAAALALQSTKAFVSELEMLRALDDLPSDVSTPLATALRCAIDRGTESEVAEALVCLDELLGAIDGVVATGDLTDEQAAPLRQSAMRASDALSSIDAVAACGD